MKLSFRALAAALCMQAFLVASLATETWNLDLQPDIVLTTVHDCSEEAVFIPSPDGGTFVLNSPDFVGDIRVERIRRLDANGALDPLFNFRLPAGSIVERAVALQDGGLICVLHSSTEGSRVIRVSRAAIQSYIYPSLAGRPCTLISRLRDGSVLLACTIGTPKVNAQALYRITPADNQVQRLAEKTIPEGNEIVGIADRDDSSFFLRTHAYDMPTSTTLLSLSYGGEPSKDFSSRSIGFGTDIARTASGSFIYTSQVHIPPSSFMGLEALAKDTTTSLPPFTELFEHIHSLQMLPSDQLLVEARKLTNIMGGLWYPPIPPHQYNSHGHVVLLSSSGKILRDFARDLPAGHDCSLAGTMGNGALVLRHGPAVHDAVQSWEMLFPRVRIHKPTLSWVMPEGKTLQSLSKTLQVTRQVKPQGLHPDRQGGLLLTGNFTTVNGLPRPGLARIRPDGQLDPDYASAAGVEQLNGTLHFLAADGSLFLEEEALASEPDAEGYFEFVHSLKLFDKTGKRNSADFPTQNITDKNRLQVLDYHEGRTLVSSFQPDNSKQENFSLRTLYTGPVAQIYIPPLRFSGLKQALSAFNPLSGSMTPQPSGYGFENPVRKALPLPDNRLAIFSGVNSEPLFTSVNEVKVPGFCFLTPMLQPDLEANARLGGLSAVFNASADAKGKLQVLAEDVTTGLPVTTSLGLLPDGNRDPEAPGVLPPVDPNPSISLFKDKQGNLVAASGLFEGTDGTLWSRSPLAHWVRDSVAGELRVLSNSVLHHPGERVCFTVVSENPVFALYQWYFKGVIIHGETRSSLVIPQASSDKAGEYRVDVTIPGKLQQSLKVQLSLGETAAFLSNISLRGQATPKAPLILGTSVETSSTHKLLIRTLGRGLSPLIPSAPLLGDSKLSLYAHYAGSYTLVKAISGGLKDPAIISLSNKLGAFPVQDSTAQQGSALAPTLGNGVYSLVSESTDGSSGLALTELYLDSAPGATSGPVRNLSARAYLPKEGEPLIIGLVLQGATPLRVLLRGVGPSLVKLGVADALQDPVLEFHADQASHPFTLQNDDWSDNTDIAKAAAQVGAFPLDKGSKDAALLLTLAPGVYTLVVKPASPSAGTLLLEAYVID